MKMVLTHDECDLTTEIGTIDYDVMQQGLSMDMMSVISLVKLG